MRPEVIDSPTMSKHLFGSEKKTLQRWPGSSHHPGLSSLDFNKISLRFSKVRINCIFFSKKFKDLLEKSLFLKNPFP